MKATYEGHEIVIRIDTNDEKLLAHGYDGNHYIPCAKNCGSLLIVPHNVVGDTCAACIAKEEQ